MSVNSTSWSAATTNSTNFSKPTVDQGSVTNYNAAVSYNAMLPYNGMQSRTLPLATTYANPAVNATNWS